MASTSSSCIRQPCWLQGGRVSGDPYQSQPGIREQLQPQPPFPACITPITAFSYLQHTDHANAQSRFVDNALASLSP